MCGIFGISTTKESGFTRSKFESALENLFICSESRGKEASGLAICHGHQLNVLRGAVPASDFIQNEKYLGLIQDAFAHHTNGHALQDPICCIGHSRLVTDGDMSIATNNQPVVKNGVVCIHNGIIVNKDSLWTKFSDLHREFDVDTEIIPTLLHYFQSKGERPLVALKNVFQLIEGTASIAVLSDNSRALTIATNNGSLYYWHHQGVTLFASEEIILHRVLKPLRLPQGTVKPVRSGFGVTIDLETGVAHEFQINSVSAIDIPTPLHDSKTLSVSNVDAASTRRSTRMENEPLSTSETRELSIDTAHIEALRRCTKCILPETMPFIDFDVHGVCNYCRHYIPNRVLGEDTLLEQMEKHRRTGKPDCLVTLSGGRDSSFGLHYVKTVLKMNPVTYTYDWGMVTDLARRNQARLCGKLGVEHILVSADIIRKRSNIRKNVLAWLKRPNLGTVPLFMAGDKQYFYYTNKIRDQLGVDVVFLCENMLENTGFKSGFCGVRPVFDRNHTYTLSSLNKLKMAFYYAKEYLLNPSYLNSSVLDTLGAFASYYFIPHNYINLFDYVHWEESKINNAILGQYNWEKAVDTASTWRIGDGTAAFYNYIYFFVAGFSENDTFRSNQIREGMLKREEALQTAREENRPRFESIQWYCDTIGIDMRHTLRAIKNIPTLYDQ